MGDLEGILRSTAEQIEQRLSMRDQLEVPREVEHFAYFRRKSAARAAAAELRTHGYGVRTNRAGLRHVLVATKSTAVTAPTAESFVRQVHAVVVSRGGDYDGWGAEVEQSQDGADTDQGDVWARYEALGHGNRSELPEVEQDVFAICDLRQEVSSGGFDSYFRYWGGDTAQDALAALPEVPGSDWADLLAEAMGLLGEPYSDDSDERAGILDENDLDDELDAMDTRFYELEAAGDADALLAEYLAD